MKYIVDIKGEIEGDYEIICKYEERSQGEWTETKHRLNLLIGVLYTNKVISENDIEYIEDSIKKLIKGGENK